jgi:hypothetical protein
MRDALSRTLLSFGALTLIAGGAVHASAFGAAAAVMDGAQMPAFYVGASKALWLSDSANLFVVGAAFALFAFKKASIGRGALALLAMAPLSVGAVIYVFMGSFFAGHLMMIAAALSLIAAGLRGPTQQPT